MLISKERRKRGRRRASDRHGINICNRCAVGDCGPVGPVERLGSYWTHVFDHLAADGAGLAGGQVAVVALLQVDANLP